MSTAPLVPGRPPGWLQRPGPPSVLRDAPCRRRPDLFAPKPITVRSPNGVDIGRTTARRNERAEVTYRFAKAKRICNGAPGYDEPCPFRKECLTWALEAKERVVAGGVTVTLQMIKGYHYAKEDPDAVTTEAGTPADWARELAAYAWTRQRKPDQGSRGRGRRESA